MKVTILRHGETEWSLSGKHTGLTDLPLTMNGEKEASLLGLSLKGVKFDHIFCSPLIRAKETCKIAGYAREMKIDPALVEWDYGDYEGLTTSEIHQTKPNWTIFSGDPPHGETSIEIGKRADLLIQRLKKLGGEIAIFSSGHFSRVFAARWLQQPVSFGSHLMLSTASKSIVGFEREEPAILLWNDTSHLSKLV